MLNILYYSYQYHVYIVFNITFSVSQQIRNNSDNFDLCQLTTFFDCFQPHCHGR
jgi:hypothetical protein